MKKETYRVKIYSLPSKNGNTKLKYFADVPQEIVGQVIATMLPHGKAVPEAKTWHNDYIEWLHKQEADKKHLAGGAKNSGDSRNCRT